APSKRFVLRKLASRCGKEDTVKTNAVSLNRCRTCTRSGKSEVYFRSGLVRILLYTKHYYPSLLVALVSELGGTYHSPVQAGVLITPRRQRKVIKGSKIAGRLGSAITPSLFQYIFSCILMLTKQSFLVSKKDEGIFYAYTNYG